MHNLVLDVRISREVDGRYLAEIVGVSGALAYGATANEAVCRAQALALKRFAHDVVVSFEAIDSLLFQRP